MSFTKLLLSKLDPKLSPADQFDVIKVSTDAVYPLPLANASPNLKKKDVGVVSLRIDATYQNRKCYVFVVAGKKPRADGPSPG